LERAPSIFQTASGGILFAAAKQRDADSFFGWMAPRPHVSAEGFQAQMCPLAFSGSFVATASFGSLLADEPAPGSLNSEPDPHLWAARILDAQPRKNPDLTPACHH